MAINFNSGIQTSYLAQGQVRNDELVDIVHDATGIKTKIVCATRHTIISGAPGVGKTYTTLAELDAANVPYVCLTPGMTEIAITVTLATHTKRLKDDEELIVVIDDADDIVFGDLKTLNRWKLATSDNDPKWSYEKDMSGTISKLEKQKMWEQIKALKSFRVDGGIGIEIPLDRVRFVILCNTDLEDPKSLSKKLFNSVEAVIDRFHYERLEMPWQEKWGWLAYILSTTQPFDNIALTDDQKKEILTWLYANWPNLKSASGASYRFVLKLSEYMINEPTKYLDKWNRMVK